jgi:hypothetical protein
MSCTGTSCTCRTDGSITRSYTGAGMCADSEWTACGHP